MVTRVSPEHVDWLEQVTSGPELRQALVGTPPSAASWSPVSNARCARATCLAARSSAASARTRAGRPPAGRSVSAARRRHARCRRDRASPSSAQQERARRRRGRAGPGRTTAPPRRARRPASSTTRVRWPAPAPLVPSRRSASAWSKAARRLPRSAVVRASSSSWSGPNQAARDCSRQGEEVVEVSVADQLGLAALGEPLGAVLADGLEHPVAHPAADLVGHEHGLVDQAGHRVEDVDARLAAHGLDRVEVGAALEDRHPGPQGLLGSASRARSSSPPTPAASGAAAVRPWRPTVSTPNRSSQPLGELRQAEHAQPRGGQLDGQRDAVEAGAQPADRPRRWRASTSKLGIDQPGPLDEQLHGLERSIAARGGRRSGVGSESGSTTISCSPATPSGWRLVASTRRPGDSLRSRLRPGCAHASTRCSQLSRTSSSPPVADERDDRGFRVTGSRPRCRAWWRAAVARASGIAQLGELDEERAVGEGAVRRRRPADAPAGSCRRRRDRRASPAGRSPAAAVPRRETRPGLRTMSARRRASRA